MKKSPGVCWQNNFKNNDDGCIQVTVVNSCVSNAVFSKSSFDSTPNYLFLSIDSIHNAFSSERIGRIKFVLGIT